MVELGYALSSEEHMPNDLVRYAQQAEAVGFTFALISDHYHPWISEQGNKQWPNSGMTGQLTQELRTVTFFEQTAKMVTEDQAVEHIVCGPNLDDYLENLQELNNEINSTRSSAR